MPSVTEYWLVCIVSQVRKSMHSERKLHNATKSNGIRFPPRLASVLLMHSMLIRKLERCHSTGVCRVLSFDSVSLFPYSMLQSCTSCSNTSVQLKPLVALVASFNTSRFDFVAHFAILSFVLLFFWTLVRLSNWKEHHALFKCFQPIQCSRSSYFYANLQMRKPYRDVEQ